MVIPSIAEGKLVNKGDRRKLPHSWLGCKDNLRLGGIRKAWRNTRNTGTDRPLPSAASLTFVTRMSAAEGNLGTGTLDTDETFPVLRGSLVRKPADRAHPDFHIHACPEPVED